MRETGNTRTQGWEIGVRRTLPTDAATLWRVIMSAEGLALWLGAGASLTLEKGATYQTADGTTGEIRSVRQGSLIRMTRQPRGTDQPSTLQIRVNTAKSGATLSIHHERLVDGGAREQMKQHWTSVIDRLKTLIPAR